MQQIMALLTAKDGLEHVDAVGDDDDGGGGN